MLIKYHWFYRITLGIVAITSLAGFIIAFNEPSLLFTAAFFLFAGSLITFEGKNYRIFQIAYFWLVIFSIFQASFFFYENGNLFDRGGDDKYFFKEWILLGLEDISLVQTPYNPYKTFVLPVIYFLKFLEYLGLNAKFSFHVNLCNAFVGAFIPVFVFKTSKFFICNTKAQLAAAFVIFYPFFNYQCVKIMRDVDVYLLFTIAVFVLSSKWRLGYKAIIIILVLFLTANVRKEALIYLLILVGSYSFFLSKSIVTKGALAILILLTFGFTYYYVSTVFGLEFAAILKFSQAYDELRQETGGGSSLATLLKNAGFLGKVVSVPYIWVSPLPPPVIMSISPMSIWISIGCLLWYYLVPRGAIQLFQNARKFDDLKKKALSLALLVTFLVGSVFISYTSGEPRHILVFFPIFVIFCFGYFENRKQRYESNLNYLIVIIGLLAITTYIFIKMLL